MDTLTAMKWVPGGAMTKTPIDVDDALLAKAAEILGTKTKKDTVNGALADVVRREMIHRHLERLKRDGLGDYGEDHRRLREEAWR